MALRASSQPVWVSPGRGHRALGCQSSDEPAEPSSFAIGLSATLSFTRSPWLSLSPGTKTVLSTSWRRWQDKNPCGFQPSKALEARQLRIPSPVYSLSHCARHSDVRHLSRGLRYRRFFNGPDAAFGLSG